MERIVGKHVGIRVNGTLVAVVETAGDGSYSATLNLKPIDNKATNYQIEAIFYGDNALNLTLTDTTPNGTQYAVCTTLQYFGYKPASNATLLTVEPQSTQVMRATKTPEQMQQEAQDSGWLSVWHEFSWWFPWYRLHFVAVVANEFVLDVGLSPLGCDILSISSQFGSWLDDAIRDLIIYPVVKAYLIGWIASEITLFAAMYYGLPGFLAGLGLSLVIKEALFMSTSDSGLKGAFVGALFSLAYGFLSALKKVVDLGITTVSAFLEVSKLNLWKLLFKFIYVPINMIYLIRIIFKLVAVGVW